MKKTPLLERIDILIGSDKPFAWASKVGIPVATFSRVYNEGGQLKTEALVRISEITGCSIDWLLTGEGPMKRGEEVREHYPVYDSSDLDQDEYALIPRYNVEVSAGGGALVDGEVQIGTMAFKREWLRRMGYEVGKLALVTARGDSMEPTVCDGDLLLVDMRQAEIVDGAIHVIRINDHLLAKRLQIGLTGQVIVRSDNVRYSPMESTRDALQVVGRVVWRGGRM